MQVRLGIHKPPDRSQSKTRRFGSACLEQTAHAISVVRMEELPRYNEVSPAVNCRYRADRGEWLRHQRSCVAPSSHPARCEPPFASDTAPSKKKCKLCFPASLAAVLHRAVDRGAHRGDSGVSNDCIGLDVRQPAQERLGGRHAAGNRAQQTNCCISFQAWCDRHRAATAGARSRGSVSRRRPAQCPPQCRGE